MTQAETAIATFDSQGTSLANTEALARILLRAEAVASSRIEGLEVGARRLLRAEVAIKLGEAPTDVTATEVLANIDAMAAAIRSIEPGDQITPNHVLGFHRRLLSGTRLEDQAGRIRTEQNWIGGSDYNPCSAAFVPPHPKTSGHSWRTFAHSPITTISRPLPRRLWLTLNSRPSIHSLTATDVPGAPSST